MVKRLTLLRHAHAKWKGRDIPDFERPLNRRGAAEAEAIGRRIAQLRFETPVILASPALRTRQTAEALLRELRLGVHDLRFEEALYLAEPEAILAVVHAMGPRLTHLLVVGHNPGLSETVRRLAPTAPDPLLATANFYSLTFEAPSWTDISPQTLRDCQREAPPARLFRLWA